MLRSLRIKGFAIIDEITLDFHNGFTVFTGETGAGKSILVDALSLTIGGRASADAVRDGDDEAVVEAIFEDIKDSDLIERMAGYGIDAEGDEIIIRRNISRNGKSRIYINGVLSTLSMLEEIGSGLVDIHGQHEHQNLLKREMHLSYLDAFGNLLNLKNKVKERYQYLDRSRSRLSKLEEDAGKKKEREEFFRYQVAEIKSAGLKAGEERELSLEREILSHSKRLTALSDEAYCLLYENEAAILSELRKVEENLDEISGIDPGMVEALELVRSSRVNLKEASEFLRGFRDDVRYDPDRLEKIEERLYLIERLKKKYGQSVEEIIACQSRIEKELEALEYSDQEIAVLREEVEQVSKEVEGYAGELSKLREKASKDLEKEVMRELSLLQMGKMRFVVSIEKAPLSRTGMNSVEFLIANMNEEPKGLTRVASGGELSRLMLAIKCRLSSTDGVQTMIFDEVDTGIGGRVAEEVGRRLKYLAKDHQVCCVTHLPQIAAIADTHYAVEKKIAGDRVVARVRKLNEEERIEEIGRMLGGKDTTRTALKYAEEMIRSGSKVSS